MKKAFLMVIALFFSITLYAQFTVFEPVNVPSRSYSVPNVSFPDPLESYKRAQAQAQAEAYARAQAMEIVSSETVSATGYELYSEKNFPMKVRIVKRKNGDVAITCLGIKKNDVWKPYDNGITSLEEMYRQAKTEKDKSTILGLMELGNFLLIIDPDKEVYIIE